MAARPHAIRTVFLEAAQHLAGYKAAVRACHDRADGASDVQRATCGGQHAACDAGRALSATCERARAGGRADVRCGTDDALSRPDPTRLPAVRTHVHTPLQAG